MGTTSFTRGESEQERELARLFQEYLDAFEAGRDIGEELLARAGPARVELAAKIGVHRDLYALSRSFGDAPDTDAPQFLGRFRILESLGQGGLSRVLLAHDPELGRRVALKVLARDELPDQEKRAWVLNEARSLASLEHPGVVRVYEVGETAGHSFIAMELLVGPSLADVLQEWRRVRAGSPDAPASDEVRDLAARLSTTSAKVELLAFLAEALAHCHDHRVLHRDIKPGNVQFDAQGRPKLIDFGLAHMSDADEDSRIGLTEALVGTAAHIAPEQVSNERTGADPQSDQFSFGTLAYECLALENPFQRPTRRATLDAVEAAAPEPLRRKEPALPPDLALVVHHALERLPSLRYPSMAALAADLRALQESRPISIRPPSLVNLVSLWLQRHRRGVLVASLALALAAAAWALTWGVTMHARRQESLGGLQLIHPETFAEPREFTASFQPLLELQREARDFDAGLLRASLFGGLTGTVQSTIDSWSRSLAEVFAHESRECTQRGVAMQTMVYRELFWEDEILCPECPYNLENRSRGTVVLPQGIEPGRYHFSLLTLLSSVPPPFRVSAFLRTTLTELPVPGYYRLQVFEPGARTVQRSAHFYVSPDWREPIEVELREPRPGLLEYAAPVEGGTYPLKGQTLTVPKFKIMEKLVTNREFARFLADTGLDRERGMALPDLGRPLIPDEPVWCTYLQALAFASWAGGRLPTLEELRIAMEREVIPRGKAGPFACGEYLCGLEMNAFTWWDYKEPSSTGVSPQLQMVVALDVIVQSDPREAAAGFRIVFELDEPALYQQLSEHPVEGK